MFGVGVGVRVGGQRFGSGVAPYVGLLDTYPNAAAAYSGRLLKSDNTGSAIRVRRSSDNAEQNIGFDGSGNLDTTALTSFCGAGNGFVTTWYDQSGGGNNLTQTTAAAQPQIVSSGSVITTLGGKPCCQFDGTKYIYKNWTFTLPQPYTNISVNRFESITVPNNFPYIMRNEYGNDSNLSLMGSAVTGTAKNRIYNGSDLNHSLDSAVNTNYLWFAIPNTSLTINNVTTTGNSGANSLTNGITLGTYNGIVGTLNGYISEQIIYSGSKSSDQTGIQNNINTYYGIY
jgi:hypothetical protein